MRVLPSMSDPALTVHLTVHRLFVYGSLLSGLSNHHILQNCGDINVRLISNNCLTVEKFFLTGLKSNEYPYLSEVPLESSQIASQIRGELYEVSSPALATLDLFEDAPREYLRSTVEVFDQSKSDIKNADSNCDHNAILSANIYLLKNEERIAAARIDFHSKFVLVNNGDWRKHFKNLQNL
jgi:gamma-glutamylcyclotransferase (GGCT)/AIG2-like uncharacterized protein YtfP